ncbi:haloacid dehalogenase type II [Amycolatopsis samaneae]|uniref:Haloacid dehalogenase type II n=1 Tax=Amycolatopsis samaneae TaxID=664691 RepID=A0ABW5GSW7_9PSEU
MTDGIRAICFDVYGTVVDYRPALIAALERFGATAGLAADWPAIADEWRASERVAMDTVNEIGHWRDLDALRAEGLRTVFGDHDLPEPSDAETAVLVGAWARGRPWPDVPAAMARLRERFLLATLSNSTITTLAAVSRHTGLVWDAVFSSAQAGAYKPAAAPYQRTLGWLAMDPAEVLLVAAHPYDLRAARGHGMRTAFVPRPLEYGPGRLAPTVEDGEVDLVADDFADLATRLGA